MNVQQAVEQACAAVGIVPPRSYREGCWTKTDTLAGKSGKGDGRIRVEPDRITAFNWQTGEKGTVWLKDEMTPVERKQAAERRAKNDREEKERAVRSAAVAKQIIAAAAASSHSYLIAKGFRDERALVVDAGTVRHLDAANIREKGYDYIVPKDARHAIVVPARKGPNVSSVQLIWEDGTKKFLFGGEIGGTCHRICSGVDTWLCEGFATAHSVRDALHGMKVRATVLVCFSASNVLAVSRKVQGRRAFIAADNDKPLPQFDGLGTGEFYARSTGLPYGMPPDVGTDFNDLHQRDGVFAVQRVLTTVMAGRSA
jgi:putative DNA primase/helicase